MLLDPADLGAVVDRYKTRIREHGLTTKSLNSGGPEKQRLRHQVHASAVLSDQADVLDVGCGLGEFYAYLKSVGWHGRYVGYDVVEPYIAECRQCFPEATFECRNILEAGISCSVDTIVMSQVFNNRYQHSDNVKVSQTAISLAFQSTKTSVSIDMMSSYVDYQNPALFYYEPEVMFKFAKSVTRRVRLRHDYRPFEFCLQLFHEDAPDYVP